jgi:hypothetical protein
MPWPTLLYAPGVKTGRRQRLGRGPHRVVCGTQAALAPGLAVCGWPIPTALVERLKQCRRQRVAAVGRRSATPCKSTDGWCQPRIRFQGYPNCVLPHASLRQVRAAPVPTKGHGSAKGWRPWTPAMAAGWTDHVWSLTEVWLYRVPPWPPPQTVSNMPLGDARGVERLRCAQRQANGMGRGVEHTVGVLMTG